MLFAQLMLQTGQPQQTREVTAELGCVTPYIVCPGQWSQSDLEYHARTVVAGMTHNAGHNCVKAEVLMLDRDWSQREAFLAALRCALPFPCPFRTVCHDVCVTSPGIARQPYLQGLTSSRRGRGILSSTVSLLSAPSMAPHLAGSMQQTVLQSDIAYNAGSCFSQQASTHSKDLEVALAMPRGFSLLRGI